MLDDRLLYLFCLTDAEYDLNDLPAEIAVHSCRGLLAVYQWVAADEFCGTTAEQNLQNIDWLIPRAQYHDAVIASVMQQTAVLPARFGTLFSNLAALSVAIAEQAAGAKAFLQRTQHQHEWSVKAWLERDVAITALAQQGEELRMSSGTNYLRRKQAQQTASQQLNTQLQQHLQTFQRTLETLVSMCRERQLMAVDEHSAEMVGNWACLLDTATVETVKQQIMQFDTEHKLTGLHFEISGPWAPYSFATINS